VRFEHTLFSLPLILAGVFSAPGPALAPSRWALIAVAAVGARTAAMALNRLIDRRLDALNPRTRVRELPSGKMRLGEAVLLLVVSTLAYLLACAALGPWFLRVAFVPLAVFTLYPYLKRWTPLCHFGVGLALALAPLAGYAAAHPALERWPAAVTLSVFALCWVSGFDVIYATLDEEFDRAHHVHSLVAWLGRARSLAVSWALHLLAALALALAALLIMGGDAARGAGLGALLQSTTAIRATDWGIAVGVLFAATVGLLYLEQRWAEDVNLAFFKINVWVGVAVLAIVLAARMAAGGF
jgi:4-hydroxybenzoate polyprenyltransferase